jgi:hypothetical protein
MFAAQPRTLLFDDEESLPHIFRLLWFYLEAFLVEPQNIAAF